MTIAGFTTRPLALSDADAYADTVNAVWRSIGASGRMQAEFARLEWQEPRFELSSSSIGCFDADERLAAYAILWATAEQPVRPHVDWGIHPAHRSEDLAETLLAWGHEQALGVMARCPDHARVSLASGVVEEDAFAIAAMQRAGYAQMRAFYDMELEMSQAPQPCAYPPGFVARAYQHDRDLPLLVEVVRDAFSDHFGYIEEPFDKDLELFRHWLDKDPHFDPALLQLPVDEQSGEAAGCLIGLRQDSQDAEAGYVDTVGVRRKYRRRGLASAMLRRSFAMFWQRGQRKVHLDVDGASLTNAVALYERVGMQVYRRHVVYEKLLRDGVELANVSLDAPEGA